MEEEFIKVDTSNWKFQNLEEWFASLSDAEITEWSRLLNKTSFDEGETDIILETALMLYCTEMGITELPFTDEFIHKIINSFVRNFYLLKLSKLGLVKIEGQLNMISLDTMVGLTEKGIEIGDMLIKNDNNSTGNTETTL